MAFTYDITALADPNHADHDLVRARTILGDTLEDSPLLEDEEILVHLQEPNVSFYEATARAGETILARYTHEANISVGNYRVELNNRISSMRELVDNIRTAGSRSAKNIGVPVGVPAWMNGYFRKGMMSGGNGGSGYGGYGGYDARLP